MTACHTPTFGGYDCSRSKEGVAENREMQNSFLFWLMPVCKLPASCSSPIYAKQMHQLGGAGGRLLGWARGGWGWGDIVVEVVEVLLG